MFTGMAVVPMPHKHSKSFSTKWPLACAHIESKICTILEVNKLSMPPKTQETIQCHF